MDGASNIGAGALTALQMQPIAAPHAGTGAGAKQNAVIEKTANEFESVFIAQFLGAMFSNIKTDGMTGGGQGEEMFRSLLTDKFAQGIQQQGGFGLADQVKAQMLKMQEIPAEEAL